MKNYVLIGKNDNVIVALRPIEKGTYIEEFDLTVMEDITMGHKIAIVNIETGENIVKYGYPIGHATKLIEKGYHAHTHNIKTNLDGELEYTYTPSLMEKTSEKEGTFMGFKRKDGQVGVRNEIWVIPTVGCVNSVALAIAKEANSYLKGSVNKVIAFTHPYGCSQMGDDWENTNTIITNLGKNPNAGGVLFLGLGCEYSGVDIIEKRLGDYDKERVKFLISQEVEDEVETAVEIIKTLIDTACGDKREETPLSKLIVGLKCGGSDGLSGITANPCVGKFSDLLVEHGGTTILTEVPEMFGAETILMNRCVDEKVFQKTVKMINGFKQFFISHDLVIYENPSPGNKAGGISTLEDKSLGCTQKAGFSDVVDILEYAQAPVKIGLHLMDSPSNDLVASTALAAAGAQIVLFTTGRGTPFASPVPTVKISTNTPLATKKSGWIDFNAGEIVNGQSIEDAGMGLFQKVLATANGEQIKSEEHGYYDMAIFKKGVTL